MFDLGINDNNFNIFAAKHYDVVFFDETEFNEDLKRFIYLKRLFNIYLKTGEIKERLIINHLVVIFNVWPSGAIPMLFFKLNGYEKILKSFLVYMGREDKNSDNIEIDDIILKKCRKI